MRSRLILTVCLGFACAPLAQAQTSARYRSPVDVNDCTFARDPSVLRDCIDLIEGQRLGPIITRSPRDPIVSPQLLREAEADPQRRRRRGGEAQIQRPLQRQGVRPVGFDPVRVEQVKPRNRVLRFQ